MPPVQSAQARPASANGNELAREDAVARDLHRVGAEVLAREGAHDAVCRLAGVDRREARAGEVFRSLLPGPLGQSASISCGSDGPDLTAQVGVTFDSPTPGMPTFNIVATGRATQEPFP